MITLRPVTNAMIEAAAEAAWDAVAEPPLQWEQIKDMPFPADMLRRKMLVALEAAIPQDADWLREFGRECLRVADIIDGGLIEHDWWKTGLVDTGRRPMHYQWRCEHCEAQVWAPSVPANDPELPCEARS